MKNRGREILKEPRRLILDIVIVILTLAVLFSLYYAISSFREAYEDGYSVDTYYYRIEEGRYAELVELYYAETDRQDPKDSGKEECYAVARYYEAASYYKMYLENGDTEKAEEQRQRMEEIAGEMGELSGEQENIRRQLGI